MSGLIKSFLENPILIYSPRVPSKCYCKDCWTSQDWNFFFKRYLNDWEAVRVAKPLKEIEVFTCISTVPDTIKWIHSENGVFSVNRIYKRGNGGEAGGSSTLWKYVSVSIAVAPTKVKCFSWLVVRKACLTIEAFKRKGMPVLPRCFLCNEVEETNSHMSLHCKSTSQL